MEAPRKGPYADSEVREGKGCLEEMLTAMQHRVKGTGSVTASPGSNPGSTSYWLYILVFSLNPQPPYP